ncbi:alpha/beta fold hydrolase [Nocardia wallacei]|uniref:alpha/beta fold hydrolase n=1 Tax=Nocardia wallacei TaxID=480035 RepID=UPI002458A967|nr:hypothetical protein [Nocardia wallacei]
MESARINETRLAFVDAGPSGGTPVVLSHSLFFDRTMFDALARQHAIHRYRTIGYDHRGQGATATATRTDLSADTLTEDAATLIESLG